MSEPQVPHMATLRSTSPSPGVGTGFSTTRMSPWPARTAARMVAGISVGRVGESTGNTIVSTLLLGLSPLAPGSARRMAGYPIGPAPSLIGNQPVVRGRAEQDDWLQLTG